MSVDSVFQALGDPTRRALLERLGDGPLSVSELAAPLAVSLAAVVQHLHVLEQSDLIRTEKIGRVRTCAIAPGGLDIAEQWLQGRRALTERRLDRLGALLAQEHGVAPQRWEKTSNEYRTDQTRHLHRRTHLPGGRCADLQGVLRHGHQTSVVRRRARAGGSRSSPLTSGRPATRRAASDMPMVRRSPTTPATWTSSPMNGSCSPT